METTQNLEASRTIPRLPVKMPWRGSPRSNQRAFMVKDAPRHATEVSNPDKDLLTGFLGWFSIGLGLAEILAPEAVARLIGVHERRHRKLLRLYGIREIAAGVAIIARPKPTYWMWNRVIGDAIDLVSMGRAMGSRGTDESRLRMAMVAVAGVTALDIATSIRLTSERSPAAGHDAGSFQEPEGAPGQQVLTAAVTVNRPIEDVYAFWKDPRNYARFMDNIDSVNPTTGDRSHWKVKAPAGLSVEWDAEIVADEPNEVISWRSTERSSIDNSGTVTFRQAPGNRGTIVSLQVQYKPGAGIVGAGVARFFSSIPKTHLANDLRRFKQLVEVGEVLKSDATAVDGVTHPGQPPARHELEASS